MGSTLLFHSMHADHTNRRVCAKVRPVTSNTAHSYVQYVPDFTVMDHRSKECRWVHFLGCATYTQNSNCQISFQGYIYYDEWVNIACLHHRILSRHILNRHCHHRLLSFSTVIICCGFLIMFTKITTTTTSIIIVLLLSLLLLLLLLHCFSSFFLYFAYCYVRRPMHVIFVCVTADHVICSAQAEFLCHTRAQNGFSFAHIILRICVRNSVRFFSLVPGRLRHHLLRNVQHAPCYFFFGYFNHYYYDRIRPPVVILYTDGKGRGLLSQDC